jgi:hypothetical protein
VGAGVGGRYLRTSLTSKLCNVECPGGAGLRLYDDLTCELYNVE